MSPVYEEPDPVAAGTALGPALRRAWVAYQRRLDTAMADAGFDDRRFPDGRVLSVCRDTPDVTISQIGRELGITRQGAAKVVAALHDRGFVSVGPSASSGREKTVSLTRKALRYLAAQRTAARRIERQLRRRVGADAFDALERLVHALTDGEDHRLRDYLREKGVREF